MTDHLPECLRSTCRTENCIYCLCICVRLRACEKRVRDDEAAAWLSAVHQVRHGALTDALEAVEALPFFIPDPDGVMYKGGMSDPAGLRVWLDRDAALSVIDKLKENDQ